ncbi:DUF4030 domain-containing protein [Bacillus sp. NTK071]|uniref:DUF4030 domain-containing protein n=1 Tax=Bacillus sp. NTK071 TaxID=2802175 RepID=UPI001A8FF4E0|nr:DUF4030 domain-containing protein [Bacillus sp. NTK071]MBN8208782.1 DUF4030 domain-containing protein [Bacillus sp. NTK071]
MKREIEKGKVEFDQQYSIEQEESIRRRVKDRLRQPQRTITSKRKLVYFSAVATLVLGLIVSLSFVSPSMASVISKIPFLNDLMDKEESIGVDSIGDLLIHELKERDYKVSNGTNIDFREKTISFGVTGSEEYYQNNKEDIIEYSHAILEAHELEAYKVEVGFPKNEEPYDDGVSAEMKRKYAEYEKRSLKLSEEISSSLNERHYKFKSADVWINDQVKNISLEIPVSESRIEEIKEVVRKVAEEKESGKFTIKVYRYDPVREEAERRWSPVIDTLVEGLIGKDDLQVELVGFTFYSDPYKLSVDTAIKESDPNALIKAENIEEEIHTFINSEKIQEIVEGDDYQVVIYSKENKEIN